MDRTVVCLPFVIRKTSLAEEPKKRKPYFLILVMFIAACSYQQPCNEGIAVTDMLGRELIVPARVERVVGIRAGALRLLVYMNASAKVAGIEEGESRGRRTYLLAHPELLQLPTIGPIMGGDAEMIMNVRPDVIFTAYSTVGEADALQEKTGIPVVALACTELDDDSRDTLYSSLRLIGRVMGNEARADSLIRFTEQTIGELSHRTADIADDARPTVYIGGVSYGGMKDITSTQPAYPPFLFVNAANVAASPGVPVLHVKGTYIDREQLMAWNPDVLFIDRSGLSLVRNDLRPGSPLSETLSAVANNRVYTLLPYNNYAINYELVLINSWYVGQYLYPTAFADVDIAQKANAIMKMFLGKEGVSL